jgi:hypothetical protein
MSKSKPYDLSRSLTALEQDSTLIAVIEMSHASWLVAGLIPGVDRRALKKLDPMRLSCVVFWIVGARKRSTLGG